MAEHIGYLSSMRPFNKNLQCLNPTCGCRLSNFIWISHNYKKVYIETPKCGCSSIKKALGIKLTPEISLTSFVRMQHEFITGSRNYEPKLSSIGFGQKINLIHSDADRMNNKILRKMSRGILESDPVGKFKFCHYYGNLDDLISKHPDYDFFCITRDPLKRFLSGVNMFYNSEAFPERRIQRITHSPLTTNENLDDIVDDVLDFPNHHFNPISLFSNTKYISKINFIDLSNLNDFLKSEFGMINIPHDNKAKSYKYKISDLSDNSISKIEKYYEVDHEIFSMVNK